MTFMYKWHIEGQCLLQGRAMVRPGLVDSGPWLTVLSGYQSVDLDA